MLQENVEFALSHRIHSQLLVGGEQEVVVFFATCRSLGQRRIGIPGQGYSFSGRRPYHVYLDDATP